MLKKSRRKTVRLSRLSRAGKAISILCVTLVVATAAMKSSQLPGSETIMARLGLDPSSGTMAIFAAAASLLFLITIFVFLSSRKKNRGQDDLSELSLEPQTLLSSVSRLEELADNMSHKVAAFNPMSDNSFKDSLLNEFKSAISADAMQSIRERYGVDRIEQIFTEAKLRKLKTISRHVSRAKSSLLTGSVICICGVIGLIYFVVANHADLMWQSQLLYYVPRLSTIILVELFACFFFSLYKRGLDDLKYLENEITDVESREVAIHAALAGGSETQIAGIVTTLLALDRNDVRPADPKVRWKNQDSINQRVTIEAISQIANLAKGLS